MKASSPAIQERLAQICVESDDYADFTYERWRQIACANCWYLSEHESAAMWDIYSKENGVAICSSISSIERAIPSAFDLGSWGLYGNAVRYEDLESYRPSTGVQTGLPILRAADLHLKRKSFEHEREYRLTSTLERKDDEVFGKYVPLSLEKLIEKVHVSPTAPDWIVHVVQNDASKYGLGVEVVKSDLYGPVK